MRITIPLTIELEVADQSVADLYLNTDNTVKDDFIADLFDDEAIEYLLYGTEDYSVLSICGKTQAQIKLALNTRIP